MKRGSDSTISVKLPSYNDAVREAKAEEKLTTEVTINPNDVKAPDGGWGWLVVLASFLINFVVDGFCYNFSTFYKIFIKEFHGSNFQTSLIGALCNGCYLLMGPIASALVNKYGCRKVSIVGAILASACFTGAAFANSIKVLIIVWGVLGGCAFGLLYLPSIVVVGFYFDQRRAFATGLAVAGSGVGTFAFPPFTNWLIKLTSWRSCLLSLALVILSTGILAITFKPLKKPAIKCRKEIKDSSKDVRTKNSDLPSSSKQTLTRSSDNIHENKSASRHPSGSKNEKISSSCDQINKKSTLLPSYSTACINEDSPLKIYSLTNCNDQDILAEYLRPINRADLFLSASATNVMCRSATRSHLNINQLQSNMDLARSNNSIFVVNPSSERSKTLYQRIRSSPFVNALVKMLDFSLMKSVLFDVLCFSSILAMAGFFIPFLYIIPLATAKGADEESAVFLLSVIGMANIVGRIASGYFSDKPCIDPLIVNNVSLIIAGVATALAPLAMKYYMLLAYAALFGLCIGPLTSLRSQLICDFIGVENLASAYGILILCEGLASMTLLPVAACFVSLRSILLVDLLGLQRLTNAFGILLMFQGLASIFGMPLAGMLVDISRSYTLAFILSGIVMALSGIICIPCRYIARWENSGNNPFYKVPADSGSLNKIEIKSTGKKVRVDLKEEQESC